MPASLAYTGGSDLNANPEPFLLSPIINLPPSFGSAYVGETFSCTLCANYDVPDAKAGATGKSVRDVRIEAEMKTAKSASIIKLDLSPEPASSSATAKGADLEPGQTLQRIVNFELTEEGNHVLAVTASYYELTDISGRTRTFRKLYQFICKPSLIVRTKPSALPPPKKSGARRWALEAQLENCSGEAMQLERVVLELDQGFSYHDCNWEADDDDGGALGSRKPVLYPGEVEQLCFTVDEDQAASDEGSVPAADVKEGKIMLGVLGVTWRSEMGNRGSLTTGRLAVKATD